MVREIVKDKFFLARKAKEATKDDIAVADDLLDTLEANKDKCVGMAANMIGQEKRIIVFSDDGKLCEMFNPEIIVKSDAFDTQEGCLSLEGVQDVKRYKKIKVRWQNREFQTRVKNFTGWTAQIIQHECDHLDGIVI